MVTLFSNHCKIINKISYVKKTILYKKNNSLVLRIGEVIFININKDKISNDSNEVTCLY